MPRLVIASTATAVPMGAQIYQEEIAGRAITALGVTDPAWRVRRLTVRSLRSPLPGDRRLPMGRLATAGPLGRRAIGRVFYPRPALVHRMALELPPAPLEVITLHDLVAWTHDDESAPVGAAAEELRRAAAVICVSAYTADRAQSRFGLKQTHVVPNGVAERFFDATPADPATSAALGIPDRFVLHAGGGSARKNLEGLAAAWPSIHAENSDLRLLLIGPVTARKRALFEGLQGAILAGRVADSLVPGLVSAASCVVVPSTTEGFGLPALEAMAARTPVVAADASALPEVVGDGGLLVAPTAEGLADGVLAILSGGANVATMVERGRARAAGFTWDRSAEGHAAVWKSVLQ